MESRGEASFAALPNPHNIKGGLNVFHRHFPDILLKTFVKLKWEDTHILASTHFLSAGCHSRQTSKYSPEVVNPCHRVGASLSFHKLRMQRRLSSERQRQMWEADRAEDRPRGRHHRRRRRIVRPSDRSTGLG